jgi:predicted esterase
MMSSKVVLFPARLMAALLATFTLSMGIAACGDDDDATGGTGDGNDGGNTEGAINLGDDDDNGDDSGDDGVNLDGGTTSGSGGTGGTDTGASDTTGGTNITGGADTGNDTGTDTGPINNDSAAVPGASACNGSAGFSTKTVTVGSESRSYLLSVPNDTTGRLPVVFLWHGLGDNATNFHNLLCGWVNNNKLPFILVSPVSLALQLNTNPQGIEWDIAKPGKPDAATSKDVALFDAVLADVQRQFSVDEDRIYTAGFSAGAIMSDLLGVMRGDKIAAVAAFSGIYFSNKQDHSYPIITWSSLNPDWTYPQFMAYGGPTDEITLAIIKVTFGADNLEDSVYLKNLGHDRVLCNHNSGHTIPGTLQGSQVIDFFAAHDFKSREAPSPWIAKGLPKSFPQYCSIDAGVR